MHWLHESLRCMELRDHAGRRDQSDGIGAGIFTPSDVHLRLCWFMGQKEPSHESP